jgi:hypothetical protein
MHEFEFVMQIVNLVHTIAGVAERAALTRHGMAHNLPA